MLFRRSLVYVLLVSITLNACNSGSGNNTNSVLSGLQTHSSVQRLVEESRPKLTLLNNYSGDGSYYILSPQGILKLSNNSKLSILRVPMWLNNYSESSINAFITSSGAGFSDLMTGVTEKMVLLKDVIYFKATTGDIYKYDGRYGSFNAVANKVKDILGDNDKTHCYSLTLSGSSFALIDLEANSPKITMNLKLAYSNEEGVNGYLSMLESGIEVTLLGVIDEFNEDGENQQVKNISKFTCSQRSCEESAQLRIVPSGYKFSEQATINDRILFSEFAKRNGLPADGKLSGSIIPTKVDSGRLDPLKIIIPLFATVFTGAVVNLATRVSNRKAIKYFAGKNSLDIDTSKYFKYFKGLEYIKNDNSVEKKFEKSLQSYFMSNTEDLLVDYSRTERVLKKMSENSDFFIDGGISKLIDRRLEYKSKIANLTVAQIGLIKEYKLAMDKMNQEINDLYITCIWGSGLAKKYNEAVKAFYPENFTIDSIDKIKKSVIDTHELSDISNDGVLKIRQLWDGPGTTRESRSKLIVDLLDVFNTEDRSYKFSKLKEVISVTSKLSDTEILFSYKELIDYIEMDLINNRTIESPFDDGINFITLLNPELSNSPSVKGFFAGVVTGALATLTVYNLDGNGFNKTIEVADDSCNNEYKCVIATLKSSTGKNEKELVGIIRHLNFKVRSESYKLVLFQSINASCNEMTFSDGSRPNPFVKTRNILEPQTLVVSDVKGNFCNITIDELIKQIKR